MDCWKLLEQVLPATSRVLLYGDPGTGKTYSANTLGLNGQNVYQTTLKLWNIIKDSSF